jgi:NAD(P)-dependent dehydrogenase (short-subunit alcohol dehydrogenase family)
LRVLVTGAARAIGAATVTELANRGHSVVATARDTSLLDGLAAAQILALDVTDADSVRGALDSAGEVDAVVNNAAITSEGPLESFPVGRFHDMLDTNVLGMVRVLQAVLPSWRERGSGVVVNVSSIQGRVGTPLESAYSATKHAMEAISESLHVEVAHFGIRVVIIEPGYTAPGMKHGPSFDGHSDYDELRRQWDSNDNVLNPGGRPGPETVAVAIANAIDDPATPLRVPVGDDATLVLGARASMDDAAFEAAMREALGLTW